MVFRFLRDDRELIAPAQLVAHLISHDDAAQPGAKHHDVCHALFLPLGFLAPVSYQVRSGGRASMLYIHTF